MNGRRTIPVAARMPLLAAGGLALLGGLYAALPRRSRRHSHREMTMRASMNHADSPSSPARIARPGTAVRRRFLPPQHGAWAMLAVPYLAGLLTAGFRWPDLPLLAGTPPVAALGAFLLCLAYFGGTVFYVKTMIRERGNPAYRRWSIGYHVIAFAVTAWLSPWTAALFGWLLARAALLPGRGWSPKRVGLLEIASCVFLLACLVLR